MNVNESKAQDVDVSALLIGSMWVSNGTNTVVMVVGDNNTTNVTLEIENTVYNMTNSGDTFEIDNTNGTMYFIILNDTYEDVLGTVTFLPSGDEYLVQVGPVTDLDIVINNMMDNDQEQTWYVTLGGFITDYQWVWYALLIVCAVLIVIIGILQLVQGARDRARRPY